MSNLNIFTNLEKIEKLHLTLEEFLVLLIVYKQWNYGKILQRFIRSGQVVFNNNSKTFTLVDKNIQELMYDCVNQKAIPLIPEDECIKLAKALINLFPKGLKPGTTSSWRDSVYVISKRLRNLQTRTKIKLDFQETIDATQQYLNSFNGDYTLMRTLAYYIYKNDTKGGEVEFKSDLLASIDILRNGGIQPTDTNWVNELR